MTTPEPFDLSPADAGRLVGVHPETIKRWADRGKLPSFLTPGGHRRFRRSDVDALLAVANPGPAR